jgi:cystine transport system substrate-binding protein
MLIAAALVVLSLLGVAIAGGLLVRLTTPVPRLETIQGLLGGDVLLVAIRPDHPQTQAAGTLDGFDVDVARELSTRLGVSLELVQVAPDAMFENPGAWDIALPSSPAWSIDDGAFLVTTAYYHWPHLLLVRADSGATSVDDVRGQPICAVTGDAGQAWLLGRYGPPSASQPPARPIPSTLIRRDTDAQCLEALASGEVIAAVTSTLSAADVAARSDLRAIDGPPSEPRPAVVERTRRDATELLAAAERGLALMRADGSLARLSTERFGSDLSAP